MAGSPRTTVFEQLCMLCLGYFFTWHCAAVGSRQHGHKNHEVRADVNYWLSKHWQQSTSWFELHVLCCHQPYSPNLALSDFYLLRKLKEYSRKCKFSNDTDIMCSAGRPRPRTAVFSRMERVLWRNAGTCVYQLQGTVLKNDKIWWTSVVANVLNSPSVYHIDKDYRLWWMILWYVWWRWEVNKYYFGFFDNDSCCSQFLFSEEIVITP